VSARAVTDAELPHDPGRYKWIALTNTTLGVLMASLDASIVIVIVAMPAIFRAGSDSTRWLRPISATCCGWCSAIDW
jgi:hypothetical protein